MKKSLLKKLNEVIYYKDIEKVKYLKWCYDKLLLSFREIDTNTLKKGAIYWVDFGYNIGSEIRKLRPAILWRASSDQKMWTIIPLSSKCYKDNYYFHCDMSSLPVSAAKIESMANLSYKRIREPFFYSKKIARISKKDYNNILDAIKKYYIFED